METQLPATPSQFSLSIALFTLILGLMPLFWSAVSEVKGRKVSHVKPFNFPSFQVNLLINQFVYLSSLSLFTVATIIVALSRSIELYVERHPLSNLLIPLDPQSHRIPVPTGNWVKQI